MKRESYFLQSFEKITGETLETASSSAVLDFIDVMLGDRPEYSTELKQFLSKNLTDEELLLSTDQYFESIERDNIELSFQGEFGKRDSKSRSMEPSFFD